MVKFAAGGRTVTAHSKSDSFGRKVFDELQLGTGFLSRQFAYHVGKQTQEHEDAGKLKSSATTRPDAKCIEEKTTGVLQKQHACYAFLEQRLLAGEEDAQQQAGLAHGIDDLGGPVRIGIVIFEFILPIPAHEAHQTDPG